MNKAQLRYAAIKSQWNGGENESLKIFGQNTLFRQKNVVKTQLRNGIKKTSSSFRELSSPIQNLFCIVMTPMKKWNQGQFYNVFTHLITGMYLQTRIYFKPSCAYFDVANCLVYGSKPGNPDRRGRLSTVDGLLVLTSTNQQLSILKILFFFFTKWAILMRWSTVRILPLQLGFPGWAIFCNLLRSNWNQTRKNLYVIGSRSLSGPTLGILLCCANDQKRFYIFEKNYFAWRR